MALARDSMLPVKRVLDPAAGAGTLLHWLDVPQAERYAFELRSDRKTIRDLGKHVDPERTIVGLDALDLDWSFAKYIVANPPFTLLEEFVLRCYKAAQEHAEYAVFLTPTQWWQAGKSRGHVPRPQHMYALTWRAPFMGSGADTQDTVWCMYSRYLPQDKTTLEWLPRPHMPRRGAQADPRWAVFDEIQPR